MSERATPGQVVWAPHPGRQTFCLQVSNSIRELHYGGARFGGKTDVGMVWLAAPQVVDQPRYRGLVIRRNAEDLSDWIDRAKRMYAPLGGVVSGKPAIVSFPSGAKIRTGHLKDENAFTKYVGQEYQRILIEELGLIPTELAYLQLISSCRSTIPGVRALVMSNSNPGGPGHKWIVERWRIGVRKPCVAYKIPKDGRLMMFIPATIEDNPSAKNDPHYEAFLDSLPEPLRSAWRYGRWDIFTGEAFKLLDGWHVMDPVSIPERAPLIMSFDWGWGAPFSVGWWWVDGDGRLVRFAEWYGGSQLNDGTGVHLTDREIAAGIKKREQDMGIWRRRIVRLAGSDCFSAKPDYRKSGGSARGPSTAEEFGAEGIYLSPGDDSSRLAKIRQFRQRLFVPMDPDGRPSGFPMMRVYKTCTHFIRTVRKLVIDQGNPEDIDTTGEDHAYDEACHACMARPMALARSPTARAPDAGSQLESSGRSDEPL